MHPPLHRDHPDCSEIVQQLVKCHDGNPIGKFLGACNGQKAALDYCFRMEKERKRLANSQRYKDERRRNVQEFEEYMKKAQSEKS